MAIPKDAPHPNNALRFIDDILRPEVAAGLTHTVFYANPNAASLKFVKTDVADNPTIFLREADKKRRTPPDAVPQEIRRVQTRIFRAQGGALVWCFHAVRNSIKPMDSVVWRGAKRSRSPFYGKSLRRRHAAKDAVL